MPASNLGEIRHMRSGSLNIAPQSSGLPNGNMMSPMAGVSRFDGPRSPPSKSRIHPNPARPVAAGTERTQGHVGTMHLETRYRGLTHMALLSATDTSHVPCKFFRQGACQAGNACPFSHDLGHASETICKYFAKVRPQPESRLCDTSVTRD